MALAEVPSRFAGVSTPACDNCEDAQGVSTRKAHLGG
jgi:hypothetical protein